MRYNIRVARSVGACGDKLGLLRPHVRVLRGIHRFAAGAVVEDMHGAPTGFALVLTYRTRAWWEDTSSQHSLRVRTRSGADLRHADNAPRTAFEGIFVMCYGLHWRARARDELAWKRHECRFIQHICLRWGLPVGQRVSAGAAWELACEKGAQWTAQPSVRREYKGAALAERQTKMPEGDAAAAAY